jgi:hypothetical protein
MGPTVSPSTISFSSPVSTGDPFLIDVLIADALGGSCVCLEITLLASDGAGGDEECCSKTVCVRTAAQAGCGDCNDDGVPDAVAILLGMSNDCNNDGIPDDCQGIPWPCDVEKMRFGDPNGDGSTNIADAVAMLGYLFSGAALNCVAAMDVNGDNLADISDPIYELAFLFGSGPPPVGGDECTHDSTPPDPPFECESSGCP